MEVYRLARKQFSNSLSGVGAAIRGARWNSIGLEMIYTAGNRSLAMAEVAVHLSVGSLPADYFMLTIFIPDDIAMVNMTPSQLPGNWNAFPHKNITQKLGDEFILKNQFCLLKVPSAVTKGDYNILINPFHDEFEQIKIIDKMPFPFDDRLFK